MRRVIALAWLLCCPTALSADRIVDSAGAPSKKPSLYVYTAVAWCEPCKRFAADFDTDRNFRGAIQERYIVRVYDYDRYRAYADRAGVKALPAFFADGQHWEGYRGKEEIASRLGLDWRPRDDSVPTPRAAPQDPAPAAASPGREPVDVSAALAAAYERHLEQQRTIDRLRRRLESIETRPAEPARGPAPVPETRPLDTRPAADSGTGLDGGLGALVTWGVSQLGWSLGPIGGVAIGMGVPLLYRVLRARFSRRSARATSPQPLPPAADADGPAVETRTEFIPYIDRALAEAQAWATREVVKKHPGAVGTLELFKSLVEQHLSGVGRSERFD